MRLAWITALTAAAIVLGYTLYAVAMLPPLKPWHTERLKEEFSALRDSNLDFAGYLQLEDRLFAEYRAKVAGWNENDETYLSSRFNPESPVSRLADGAQFNRSFRFAQDKPPSAMPNEPKARHVPPRCKPRSTQRKPASRPSCPN